MRVFNLILGAIAFGVRLLRKHHAVPCEGPYTDQEVENLLSIAADARPEFPDWKNSIVDLLEILGVQSGFGNRRDLWAEMGHGDVYQGTAEQNIQLHADVTAKIASRELVVP